MKRNRAFAIFIFPVVCIIFGAPSLLGAQKSSPPARIDISALASALKAEAYYDSLTGYGYFKRFGTHAVFAAGVPWVLWDWKEQESVPPPELEAENPGFAPGFRAVLERRFLSLEKLHSSMYSIAAILIDPGHGGKDTGAIAEHEIPGGTLRIVEKDLNLAVAMDVFAGLKRRFPDRRIMLTRDRDVYPTLEERVAIANSEALEENEAIIYVSIHANASFNKSARGFEVWYLNPEYRRTVVDDSRSSKVGEDIAPILNAMLEEEYTTESIILARKILSRMEKNIGKDSPSRGVRAEEWFVVRNARMPSVLIETGFITHADEVLLLADTDYLRRIADSIYTGIVDFVEYFERQKGSSVQ